MESEYLGSKTSHKGETECHDWLRSNSLHLGVLMGKLNAGSVSRGEEEITLRQFDPWVGKIPWRRERPPTLAFWPGEFHGL